MISTRPGGLHLLKAFTVNQNAVLSRAVNTSGRILDAEWRTIIIGHGILNILGLEEEDRSFTY